MKVFQLTGTHPGVLLVNNLQIRKEKWYRASTVFILTSRRTETCDICLRTKITRASCRRRTGTVVPRAEFFGDLTTADHNVHTAGCESRNNHRYAVVVQDLAAQWLRSYPCETKTSQKLKRACKKFLERTRKPEVICTDKSIEFGKSCEECEEFSWNQCTSQPH